MCAYVETLAKVDRTGVKVACGRNEDATNEVANYMYFERRSSLKSLKNRLESYASSLKRPRCARGPPSFQKNE